MTTQNKSRRIEQLIEVLADGEFHSGERLGEQLGGISRTAVNQYIETLQQLGLEVFRVSGKGYRLASPLQLLHQQQIQDYLVTEQIELPLELQRVVTSSNDVVKELRVANPTAGLTVLAEAQTAGRGRRGRQWHSPFGTNLYLSMYWPLARGLSAAMGLSVALGVGIAELLDSAGVQNVQVKWPNDVYVNNKKIAGILVELEGHASEAAHVVVGIGLNLSMPSATKNIDQPWTDLASELPSALDRNYWAAKMVSECYRRLQAYDSDGLTPMLDSWQRFDKFYQKPVTLVMGNKNVVGRALGIDDDGALLVERNGQVERFHAGELSIRDVAEV